MIPKERNCDVGFELAVEEFSRCYGVPPVVVSRAPGRVNLIGEHTDYNDGLVLPFTIQQAVYVGASPGPHDRVRVHSALYDQTIEFPADVEARVENERWQNYLRGIVYFLRRGGLQISGANIHVSGDLAAGAGISSSAALCAAAALALLELHGGSLPRLDLARLIRGVETDFAGTPCGIMDPYAILFGRSEHALLIDCGLETHEEVPLAFGNHDLVLVDTGVKHKLADGAYATRVQECQAVAEALRSTPIGPRTLRHLTAEDLASVSPLLESTLARRARHVVSENLRVRRVAKSLRAGRFKEIGACLYESHDSLRDDFEVSCPQIEEVVRIVRACPGVLGGRLVGGGFGGSVLVLLHEESLDDLGRRLRQFYDPHHASPATIRPVSAEAGATVRRV